MHARNSRLVSINPLIGAKAHSFQCRLSYARPRDFDGLRRVLQGAGPIGRIRHLPLVSRGPRLSAMDQVIGVMVVIVVIGLIADKVLFSPWERFLHRRWGTGLK